MAYRWRIEGDPADLAAHGYREGPRHCYLNVDLGGGAGATLRVGLKGVRLCVYPDHATTERVYRQSTFRDAGAQTTWVPDERDLGGGHWLHTFRLPNLVRWACEEALRALTDIGDGRLRTDRAHAGDTDRLYSSEEVAEELGITRRRVQQLAASRGVGQAVGGSLVFRLADIDAMRDRPTVGRPRKVAAE